ncbi:MAG: transglycosylase family protein [Acidobacteriaceae bacterium]
MWGCIAHYESTDSTTAVNASSGDAGAFQISQHMWDLYKPPSAPWWIPSATLAQQLEVAKTIQRLWGWSQWETAPLCGV